MASVEVKRRALKNLIGAFNTGNLKLLDKVFTRDAKYTFYGTTKFAGVNNALSTIRELGKKAFPEGIKFDIKKIIVEGEFGCIHWEDFAKKDGRTYHNYGIFFVQFKEAKVVKLWEYIDYERFKVFLDYDQYQRKIGRSAYG